MSEDKSNKTGGKSGLVEKLMAACRGPKALPALGVLSFLESSFLPVPIDLAMVPICFARARQIWLIILVGAVASVFGAIVGYLIGATLMGTIGHPLLELYGAEDSFLQLERLYAEKGWIVVLIAGITPVPFKVAAIVSGSVGMRFDLFILTAFLVRFVRFSMIAFTIRLFGVGFQKIVERHSGKFAIIIILITISGFVFAPTLLKEISP